MPSYLGRPYRKVAGIVSPMIPLAVGGPIVIGITGAGARVLLAILLRDP